MNLTRLSLLHIEPPAAGGSKPSLLLLLLLYIVSRISIQSYSFCLHCHRLSGCWQVVITSFSFIRPPPVFAHYSPISKLPQLCPVVVALVVVPSFRALVVPS